MAATIGLSKKIKKNLFWSSRLSLLSLALTSEEKEHPNSAPKILYFLPSSFIPGCGSERFRSSLLYLRHSVLTGQSQGRVTTAQHSSWLPAQGSLSGCVESMNWQQQQGCSLSMKESMHTLHLLQQ